MWNRRKARIDVERELKRLRGEFEAISRQITRRVGYPGTQAPVGFVPWLEQSLSSVAPQGLQDLTSAAAWGAGQVSHRFEDAFDTAFIEARRRPVPVALGLLAVGVVLGLAARRAAAS
ncbi:MAG: hypothetical protein NTZ14_09055 [Hyphomicrobiales bacterium]|nr:hypothetical protein [Hyphomicrobiales bacterium]